MKIRQGFVSNSSSSSFIVLLPDGFTASELNVSGNVKDAIENILAGDTIYEDDDYELFNLVVEALGKYTIATVKGGPDAGQILSANAKKVREIYLERARKVYPA